MLATAVTILIILAAMATIIIGILIRLYVKTPPNMGFIRSGLGGKKVVLDAGAIVLPIVHMIQWISLETIKLEVIKAEKEAFITKDRFRVDVGAEFYMRIGADPESLEKASRSLGERSFSAEAIQVLVEEKLVSALRSVAAATELVELHENRRAFARAVRETLVEPLSFNGLSLEDVSVFHLDQTSKEFLDPSNIFDAEGLRQITLQTSERSRERNEIERNTEVAIRMKDVEAVKMRLGLDQEREFAEAEQRKQIETYQAQRSAETEQFKHQQEQRTREAEIAKDRAIREAEIAREVGVIQRDKSRVKEEEDRLHMEAARETASQGVLTAQEKAQAERAKEVALIAALQEVEVAARRFQAVEKHAQSRRIEGEAEAHARSKIREAENLMDEKIIYRDLIQNLIDKAPQICTELMAPARNIDSIKVIDINGLGVANGGSQGTIEGVLGAILRSGAVLPLLREILDFAKVDSDKIMKKVGEHVPRLSGIPKRE
ncbi:MAG: flotillin family protein [Candidatus Binatia bacterium]